MLKNEIEKKLGKPISYNELIKMLLESNKEKLLRNDLGKFKKFKGILSQDIIQVFRNERKIDKIREDNE
ncbi:MAG: hypothetical protein ACTSRP_27675 [Candidatus Helarchaeota archaeon]